MGDFIKCVKCELEPFCKPSDTCSDTTKRMQEHHKQIRVKVIDEVSEAMYHQCFECDNDENMQKWDSGNWFRYKLFENVIEQLKENK